MPFSRRSATTAECTASRIHYQQRYAVFSCGWYQTHSSSHSDTTAPTALVRAGKQKYDPRFCGVGVISLCKAAGRIVFFFLTNTSVEESTPAQGRRSWMLVSLLFNEEQQRSKVLVCVVVIHTPHIRRYSFEAIQRISSALLVPS